MSSVFKVSIQTILTNSFGVSTDEDGIDSEIVMAAFNIGYQLFLKEFDKSFSWFRRQYLNFEYSTEGTTLEDLGIDIEGNSISNFFMPSRVIPFDDTDPANIIYYDPIIMGNDRFRTQNKLCCWVIERVSDTVRKIFFVGYENTNTDNLKFKVEYFPQFELISIDKTTTTKIDFHPKALPAFAQFLVAMYNSIEEEPQSATRNAPLLFKEYFKDIWSELTDEAPGEVDWN